MKRCRHTISMDSIKHRCDVVAHEYRDIKNIHRGCMAWTTCEKCGSWLPLGPSNDEPECVRVEIRAAEIAAELADGGSWMSPFESWGFNDELPTLRGGGHVVCNTTSQRSGYLARCIHTHGETND